MSLADRACEFHWTSLRVDCEARKDLTIADKLAEEEKMPEANHDAMPAARERPWQNSVPDVDTAPVRPRGESPGQRKLHL